jgi:hypothetical protein
MIDIEKARTVCFICGKRFDYLGVHLQRAHKVKARDYKIENGLNLSLPLTSESVMKKMVDNAANRDKALKAAFLAESKKHFFKPGHGPRWYTSDQTKEFSRKIGKANAGRKMGEKTRTAIRSAWLGKKHRPETIERMRAVKLLYWSSRRASEETKSP